MAHEKEFIQHLSKEIGTTTNAMMAFRIRIGFTVFLGPFVVLSTLMVGTKKVPQIKDISCETIVGLTILALCYLCLGIIGGSIEKAHWLQCNRWRTLIATLVNQDNVNPKSEDILFLHKRLLKAWITSFLLFFLSFIVMVYLISSLLGSA